MPTADQLPSIVETTPSDEVLVNRDGALYRTRLSDLQPTGIPPGGSTGQTLVKVTDGNYDVVWATPPTDSPSQVLTKIKLVDGAGSGLDADFLRGMPPSDFATAVHTHTITDVTGLQAALDGKQAAGSYAAAVHTHNITDVTGLQTALDGKQPLSTILTNTTASFTTAQETKLAGIAAGATVNSTDAFLLSRANHTGTQSSSTISDFSEAVDDRVAGLLVAGTNITLNYNDAANTLTINSTAGGGGTWGSITGTLSSQTDLQTALDGKQNNDATLTALAGLNSTPGLVEQTGVDVFTKRGIGVSSASDILTRGDGDERYATSGHTHSNATTSTPGFMSAADKTKLDGVEAGAQVNVATDLSYTASTRQLNSSTGADTTLPLFNATEAGLVPSSGGGVSNFLRADGTWAAPSGGGGPIGGGRRVITFNANSPDPDEHPFCARTSVSDPSVTSSTRVVASLTLGEFNEFDELEFVDAVVHTYVVPGVGILFIVVSQTGLDGTYFIDYIKFN